MSDFSNYNLEELSRSSRGVFELSDGLLPEIASATGFQFTDSRPTTQELRAFIGHIGPAKFLQDNIELVQARLQTTSDARDIASDWADRSGCLLPIQGRFAAPGESILSRGFGAAVFNTAVARWQERRARKLIELHELGANIGRVVIFGGNRTMAESEHAEVSALAKRIGNLPSETVFAALYVAPMLEASGLSTDLVEVDSSDADEIFRQGIREKPFLFDWAILAVGNAPSAIQVASQFRKAARQSGEDWESFDDRGQQFFVVGDSIEVARHGEGPETHQNPFTALGQIARNALMLHEQSLDVSIS